MTWVDGATGLRFLAPEVVLLFKARQQRPKDEIDLRSALPPMTADQRDTLRQNIAHAHPGHDWLALV